MAQPWQQRDKETENLPKAFPALHMDETTVDARFIHGRIKSGGQVMQGKRPGLIMVLMASIGLALPQFPAGAQLLGPVERTVGGLADTVTDTISSGLGATERLPEDARDLTRTR